MNYIEEFFGKYVDLSSAKRTGNSELLCKCPFHEDTKPSFSVNTMNGLWKCHSAACPTNEGGRGGGDTAKLLCLIKGISVEEARDEIKRLKQESRKDLPKSKNSEENVDGIKFPITNEDVAHKTLQLLESTRPLQYLKDQCRFTEETIQKFELGWDGERVWIPIRYNGKLVNIRRYAPKPKAGDKMLNVAGFGEARLFPLDNLQNEVIYLMEGEKDCILANQLGLNSMTVTGGAGTFKRGWIQYFAGKDIYICYDIDQAGRLGAEKVAGMLAGVAKGVYDIRLPITEPANGDFTDFILQGNTIESFLQLCQNASRAEYVVDDSSRIPEEVYDTTLYEATYNPELHQKRLKMNICILGRGETVYTFPKVFHVKCDQSLGKVCEACGMSFGGGDCTFSMNETHPKLLALMDSTDEKMAGIIKGLFQIYSKCTIYQMVNDEMNFLEPITVIPTIDSNSKYITKQMFAFGIRLENNRDYEVECIATNDPNSQELCFIVYKARPIVSSLDEFKLTDEVKEGLKVFQCPESVQN